MVDSHDFMFDYGIYVLRFLAE